MKTTLLIIAVVFAALARVPAAPRAQGGVEHFSKDGLSFDYPTGWTVEDRSNPQTQRLVLARAGGAAFVEVVAPRAEAATAAEGKAAEKSLWESSVAGLVRRLDGAKVPSEHEHLCPPYGERPGSGVKLSGRFEGRPGKAEVYEMYADGRYVNVAFFRPEREESAATPAWKTVLETLKAEGAKEGGVKRVIGAVVNGKAVSKPQPAYPQDAKAAGAAGAVTVKIVVDEKGDVIAAQAVSGDPLLHYAAEAAARHAKYTPTTICGHPVKVSGSITYTFMLR
jgi:TonB family protein